MTIYGKAISGHLHYEVGHRGGLTVLYQYNIATSMDDVSQSQHSKQAEANINNRSRCSVHKIQTGMTMEAEVTEVQRQQLV